MTVVDAHHHLWRLAVRDQDWIDPVAMAAIRRDFDLSDLAAAAGPAGVTATVAVQTVPDPAETPELLALAESGGPVAGVVGWVDLTAVDVPEALAALRAAPGGRYLVGIRALVQGEADPRWLCRPDVRRGLAAVAGAGLAFDLLVRPHQLAAAIETVRDLPALRFVLDHLGKPDIAGGSLVDWGASIGELARCGNVAAKLSGLVTEADWTQWTVAQLRPYVDVALTAFGPDRLMYGSDWPVCLLAAPYARWYATARELTAGLSPAEQASVFTGTARAWYRLSERN